MAVLGIIIFFMIIFIPLIALGIAAGYLLHWMISALSLETAILIGVISVNSAIYFLVKIMLSMSQHENYQDKEDEDAKIMLSEISKRYLRKKRRKRNN